MHFSFVIKEKQGKGAGQRKRLRYSEKLHPPRQFSLKCGNKTMGRYRKCIYLNVTVSGRVIKYYFHVHFFTFHYLQNVTN